MNALKNKFGLIVFILFMLALATMLGVLFTQGRYSEELESGSDIYGSDLEYIVSDQVEVNSVEEFIAAVENGYSNITISDNVDNPLVITSGVTDVGSDLIIDLNGHEIQRNNRDPMLNVVDGVRLTVIDSKGGGSFYNPVGSVLQIDGGTLTVTSGDFVSGPKSGEYMSNSSTGTGATISDSTNVTVRRKSGNSYTSSAMDVPVLSPHVEVRTTGEGETRYITSGNMYFSAAPTNDYNGLLEGDTYLYYVIDDDAAGNTAIAADTGTADFYYSYKVTRNVNGNSASYDLYTGTAEADGETIFAVMIYGYYNVKASANPNVAGGETLPNYATVKMMSGNMYVRGGSYYSYFGVENTFGVHASGGYMAIGAGKFEAAGAATCVACAYPADVSEEEYLRVAGGDFKSYYGDTVSVSSGNMVLTAGSFTKDASSALEGHEGSASVHVTGGSLDASQATGLTFDTLGSHVYGVYVSDGTANITNADFTFGKEDTSETYTDVIGVYAEGGSITANTLDISIYSEYVNDTSAENETPLGNYNRGISASNGTVKLYNACNINVYGTYSAGILALTDPSSLSGAGSTDSITYYGDTDEQNTSAAGTLAINVYGAENDTLSSTAMSTEGGSINIASGNVDIYSEGLGVTARSTNGSGGDIEFGGETFNVETTQGTGIYVNGGSIMFRNGTVNVKSTVDGDYSWSGAPTENFGTTTHYDGICVQGGSLDSTGATLNVTHDGIENNYYGDLYQLVIRSFAVRVTSSESAEAHVVIPKGKLTNLQGGGLYVGGDNPDTSVVLGSKDDTSGDTSEDLIIKTSGVETLDADAEDDGVGYGDEFFSNPDQPGDSNWAYKKNVNGGHAVQIEGGKLTVYSGTYAAKFGNGILVSNGKADLFGGTYAGNDPYAYKDSGGTSDLVAGSGASYGMRMHGGTLNIYGGTFGSLETETESYDGNGAFITGTDGVDAIANIYGGTFNATGRIGVSIMRKSNVVFGGAVPGDIDVTVKDPKDPKVNGTMAAIAVEKYSDGGSNSSITIHKGTYKGGLGKTSYNDGIWYGDSTSKLIITGGTIQVSGDSNKGDRSGLYFEVDPDRNVKISGGTFIGGKSVNEHHTYLGSEVNYYKNGAINSKANHERSWGFYSYTSDTLNIQAGSIFVSTGNVSGFTNAAESCAGSTSNITGVLHENIGRYQKVVVGNG